VKPFILIFTDRTVWNLKLRLGLTVFLGCSDMGTPRAGVVAD
jgi:hypothetical protein